MAVTKVGTEFSFTDAGGVLSRTFTLPAALAVNDVAFVQIAGGANSWFHGVSSPGMTWVQQDIANATAGILSSIWRGIVTNAGTASSATATVVAYGADGVTAQSFKLAGEGQVFRGVDSGGTSGSNAAHQVGKQIFASSGSTVTTPFTAATTVAGCVLWTAATIGKSTLPFWSSATYEGGTPDGSAFTSGGTPHVATAASADLTAITLGATPGGKTFAMFDATPAALSGSLRVGWSIAIAPTPVAPTVTAAIDNTDPATGTLLTLSGTVTGTATSRLWRQVSGPASPTITNSTTNTATVTPTVAGTYVFGFTATSGAGTSTEQTVTAYVHPVDGAPVPVVSVTFAAPFSVLGGGSGAVNLNDTDPATGIQNTGPTFTHTDKATIVFAPHGPGAISFELDALEVADVTARAIVYKSDGTTQIYPASGGHDWSLTTSVTTHTITLDATALAAIPTLADRRALVVKVSAA